MTVSRLEGLLGQFAVHHGPLVLLASTSPTRQMMASRWGPHRSRSATKQASSPVDVRPAQVGYTPSPNPQLKMTAFSSKAGSTTRLTSPLYKISGPILSSSESCGSCSPTATGQPPTSWPPTAASPTVDEVMPAVAANAPHLLPTQQLRAPRSLLWGGECRHLASFPPRRAF